MRRLWEILEPAKPGDSASRLFDVSIIALITANVVAVILGSVESIRAAAGGALDAFETASLVIFSVEYASRLASCTVDDRYRGAVRGRIRWAVSPVAVIDLLAIAPAFAPVLGLDGRFIRIFRLFRIFRVAKMGRYVQALRLLIDVARQKREELLVTTVLMLFLLIASSCLMFYAEHDEQPEAYPDIPTAMWWAVATLTTVGYGDVYPTTAAGRILGAIVAVAGIGFFALPTGVLGAGFVDEIQRRRQPPQRCPHCGREIRP